ncbi:N-acetyltransferase family protein [Alsobacter sp. R-9]
MRTCASPGATLRPYRPSDRAACAGIYVRARRHAFHWCPPEQFRTEDFEADSRGEVITVATLDETVVGFLSLWMPDHFIHLLFVDPPFHGRGIGRQLLEHAEVTFGDWSWLKCQAQNERALSFYRACGWSVGSGGVNELGPWVAVSWNVNGSGARLGP